ncbi:MAG: indole-3-glycerol phosphate synthase TrpC [Treponema sp.]|jgi:indole-3-glycerol phosphate synthase|nr:indole-3-glycerol phosphate synthase TrpC [Treponema sp.]
MAENTLTQGNILDEIAAKTKLRVEAGKRRLSPEVMRLRAQDAAKHTGADFEKALTRKPLAFICEVKRASPSKGLIAGGSFPYLEIAREYEAAGADAISVLTEPDYFLGSDRCLAEIAGAVKIPALRKDFVIDEYQIDQAKVLGASALLLICALLEKAVLARFQKRAAELDMAALVEVHNEAELETVLALAPPPRIIGINNRDLKTFRVDLAVTERLRPRIPAGSIVVSESGVSGAADVRRLAACGVNALLVGESFMRAADRTALLSELRAAL